MRQESHSRLSRPQRFAVALLLSVTLRVFDGATLAAEFQPTFGAHLRDLRSSINLQHEPGIDSNLPVESGVEILFVHFGGAADKAGLQDGDVIVQAENVALQTPGDFIDFLKTTKHGHKYRLLVWRFDDGRWSRIVITFQSVWAMRDTPLASGSAWDGPLMATIRESIVYVADNSPARFINITGDGFLSVWFNGKPPVERYFDDNGVPTKCVITSSDSRVLQIRSSSDTADEIKRLKSKQRVGSQDAFTRIQIKLLERR